MLKKRKSLRRTSFRKSKSGRQIKQAEPLLESDVRILRDKATRSSDWSADPSRKSITDMTVDEAAAIMLYTQECCMYRRLNGALRAHDLVELAPFLPFMKLLLRALYKLPLVRAKVYRGVKLNLAETYNAIAGQWFSWWSFSSTTLELKVLETPLFLGKEGDRTLFCIDALGVDIAAFSAMPNEREVLMLPGVRLMVEPGINTEEDPDLWTFNIVATADAPPFIDFPHPDCQDPSLTLSSSDTSFYVDGAQRRADEQEGRVVTRTTENTASIWPSIPGFRLDQV